MARETPRESDPVGSVTDGLQRRTFLRATGAVATLVGSLAGCLETSTTADAVEFGYGGPPMVREQLALPNALAGSVAALASTIEETESNDTMSTADVVPLGSTVVGSLGRRDTD